MVEATVVVDVVNVAHVAHVIQFLIVEVAVAATHLHLLQPPSIHQ